MINFSQILWRTSQSSDREPAIANGTVPEETDLVKGQPVPVEQVRLGPESRLICFTDPRSLATDRFRLLRLRLRELQSLGKLKSLVVTSPLPQDGKSTVALNLGIALAEGGKLSVIVVEADLHRPTLAQELGVERRPGLAEVIEDHVDPMSLIRRIEPLGFSLLQAGWARNNPTESLQSDAMPRLLQRLSQHFDWIVIDTPPVLPLTDAVLLSRLADASLMVVRADRTPKDAVDKALAILDRKSVAGIILNATEGLNKLYSEYYGYPSNIKK